MEGSPGGDSGRGNSLWPKSVAGLLALALAVFLIRLAQVILNPGDYRDGIPALPDSADSYPPLDLAGLQSGQLFGTRTGDVSVETGGRPATVPDSAPAAGNTTLDLKLEGVMVGNPPSAGFAMIARNNRTQTYRIGDRLPASNRVVLNGIYSDRVILENNGALETLWLYDDRRNPVRQTRGGSSRQGGDLAAVLPPPGDSYDPVALVNAFREKLMQNPSRAGFLTLSQIVKVSPAQENDRLLGYRLTPGEHLKEFVRLGFKTNDIVTRINGIELDDIANLPKLFEVMTTAGNVTLSLTREGQPLELELSLESLAVAD